VTRLGPGALFSSNFLLNLDFQIRLIFFFIGGRDICLALRRLLASLIAAIGLLLLRRAGILVVSGADFGALAGTVLGLRGGTLGGGGWRSGRAAELDVWICAGDDEFGLVLDFGNALTDSVCGNACRMLAVDFVI
jgi:hypothetical protein